MLYRRTDGSVFFDIERSRVFLETKQQRAVQHVANSALQRLSVLIRIGPRSHLIPPIPTCPADCVSASSRFEMYRIFWYKRPSCYLSGKSTDVPPVTTVSWTFWRRRCGLSAMAVLMPLPFAVWRP